jgi:hypothetical protein
MKNIFSIMSIAVSLVLVAFALVSAKPPIHYDHIVVGTNIYPDDLNNVQAAVDEGGNILLKGTFNFGIWDLPPRSDPIGVVITKDVGIYGETDRLGNPLTRINGGFFTFFAFFAPFPFTPSPSLPDPLPPGPKITIKGIHFDGALYTPIHIVYSSGATITGNKITGVAPFGPFGPIYLQSGIICSTNLFWPEVVYREGAITGSLEISNNYIDLEIDSEDIFPQNTFGPGIAVSWTTDIMAKISDNIIKNSSRSGIIMNDNYAGGFVVESNEIEVPEFGMPLAVPSPVGIFSGWTLNSPAYKPETSSLYTVMRNSIRMRGEKSGGIVVQENGSIVRNNHIRSEGAQATGLAVNAPNGYIAHNKIEGTGDCAIDVYPHPNPALSNVLNASHNFFQGNNYNLFDAALYDLHFSEGSNYNIFVGHSGDVLDEGIGNEITNE